MRAMTGRRGEAPVPAMRLSPKKYARTAPASASTGPADAGNQVRPTPERHDEGGQPPAGPGRRVHGRSLGSGRRVPQAIRAVRGTNRACSRP